MDQSSDFKEEEKTLWNEKTTQQSGGGGGCTTLVSTGRLMENYSSEAWGCLPEIPAQETEVEGS